MRAMRDGLDSLRVVVYRPSLKALCGKRGRGPRLSPRSGGGLEHGMERRDDRCIQPSAGLRVDQGEGLYL